MKKLISIMLVLLMALSVFACTGTPAQPEQPAEQPTEAPAEQPTESETPAEAPTAEGEYEGLALNIKNKTGKTINEVYIYPVGGDKGNSVVAAGWKDKEVDGDNYEKNIYIVREKGAEMEMFVVFEDGAEVTYPVGTLAMYDKLSMKGATAEDLKHEANDDPADVEAMNLVAALGKTADGVYPGYDVIPVELKNKSSKNITGFWFFEENGKAEAYNNVIGVATDLNGAAVNPWGNGRPYLFTYFVRPHAENYTVYVQFDDGTELTYPIENWFKADGDGNLPNEISLKSAEDKYETKVVYDGDVEKDVDIPVPDLLNKAVEQRLSGDGWYPTYATVEADAAAVEAAKAALAQVSLLDGAAPAQPEEPAEPEAVVEPEAPAAAVPEGYTGLGLMVKNKTGKDIAKIYLFPAGGDKGKNILKTVVETLPTEDESIEGKPHEAYAYVLRETEALAAMILRIKFADETEQDIELADPVENHTVFTLKADEFRQKVSDDAEDIAAMDALALIGEPTDGIMPGADAEAPAEVALELEAPAAAVPEGYAALALNIKNKTGATINAVYVYAEGTEDKGASLVPEGWKDKDADGDNYEKNIYIIRPAGALTVEIVLEDGNAYVSTYELNNFDKISFKGAEPENWKVEANDDPSDIALMQALIDAGVTTDEWYPAQ